MPGGLKYCSARAAIGINVLLMYGADELPLIWDQLWFSIRMMNTVLTLLICAAAGNAANANTPRNALRIDTPPWRELSLVEHRGDIHDYLRARVVHNRIAVDESAAIAHRNWSELLLHHHRKGLHALLPSRRQMPGPV